MAAGDKSSESFASFYLGTKKGAAKRPLKVAMQANLFAAFTVPEKAPEPAGPVSSVQAIVESDESVANFERDVLEPTAIRRVFTVRELVGQIREQIERSHFSVWVEGEVSNYRPAPSGHLYFTLKDGEAQLPVVLFRRQAQLLNLRPKDGDAVEVRGRISIYESRGQLQLIAETLELRGSGALELAFKQLKVKLQAEGLFEESRKRPLPAFPRCIGIVTSEQGAVLRDIIHVVQRRHARLNLLVYPAAMQGSTCAGTVARGIRFFNRHPELVDLIVLARGGGSIEDLAGFNDEALARVIAGSELPVVSAIGHETDFTIADFVADLRAPTPSAAAELVTAAQHRIEETVFSLEKRVERAGRYQMMMARQRYARLSAESVLARLRDAVSRREQHLDELHLRADGAMQRRARSLEQRLASLVGRLGKQDPAQRLALAQRRFLTASQAMGRLRNSLLSTRTTQLNHAATRLNALSPLAVLSRGYALIYDEQGSLLRNVDSIQPGQTVRARLGSGSLTATVKDISK